MLLFKMLLNGYRNCKYISVIIPTVKFILTIPTSMKNRHFHDSVLSMYHLDLSLLLNKLKF